MARDFWVRPSEAMIRRWCRDYTRALTFEQDYQPWVVAAFSGILCVDEVYQDRLALLLAVDPAAPDGDRLIGYQLVHGAVDQADMRAFPAHLREVGVAPEQVVSDGSPLYPSSIAAIRPQAAHQLCLFHETRVLTKAVRQVITAAHAALPPLPPRLSGAGGPPQAPCSPPADAPPPYRRGRGRCYTAVRQAGIATVHALRTQGVSIQGIARMTVRAWLAQPAPPATPLDLDALPWRPALDTTAEPPPPPAPWTSWAQVQQVRTAVGADRDLLLRRPEHLTNEQRAAFAVLFTSPVGPPVCLARAFLEEWYRLWRDDAGKRRPLAAARERYEHWRTNPEYATVPALRTMQERMDDARFTQLSPFSRDPCWEGTNNGAERMGRTFRHLQAPRFGLRTDEARGGAGGARAAPSPPSRSHGLATRASLSAWAQEDGGRRPAYGSLTSEAAPLSHRLAQRQLRSL